MVRLQIQLEESKHDAVRRLAHQQHTSVSAVIRQMVDQGLRAGSPPATTDAVSVLLAVAGMIKGGPGDMAARHDDYLAESVAEDHRAVGQ